MVSKAPDANPEDRPETSALIRSWGNPIGNASGQDRPCARATFPGADNDLPSQHCGKSIRTLSLVPGRQVEGGLVDSSALDLSARNQAERAY